MFLRAILFLFKLYHVLEIIDAPSLTNSTILILNVYVLTRSVLFKLFVNLLISFAFTRVIGEWIFLKMRQLMWALSLLEHIAFLVNYWLSLVLQLTLGCYIIIGCVFRNLLRRSDINGVFTQQRLILSQHSLRFLRLLIVALSLATLSFGLTFSYI